MLAYAGKGKLSSGRINLSELVRDTTSLLEVSVGKNCITRSADWPRFTSTAVLGDATQLRQIVMNLVINGSDAIGERVGGKNNRYYLCPQSRTTALCSAPLYTSQSLRHRGYTLGLEVRDNGCGMPPQNDRADLRTFLHH